MNMIILLIFSLISVVILASWPNRSLDKHDAALDEILKLRRKNDGREISDTLKSIDRRHKPRG